MSVTIMMTSSIQPIDWRRSLSGDLNARVRFDIASFILLGTVTISRLQSRAGAFVSRKAEEADLFIELADANRSTPYPLTGCAGHILCNNGDGCGRWHCPARTVDFDSYVAGVMEAE